MNSEVNELKEQFNKDVNHLDQVAVLKIIDRVKTAALNDFTKNRRIASKYLFIETNGNFVVMYFYHTRKQMKALQYVINKQLDAKLIETLCSLFSAAIIKTLGLNGIKHTQKLSELTEYYSKQIAGYKQYLKGQVN